MNELNDEEFDLLDLFVQDKLEGEQKALVLEKIRVDPRWQEEFEFRKQLNQASHNTFQKKMRTRFSQIDREERRSTKRRFLFILSAAAITGALAVFLFLLNPQKAPDLMAYYEPLPNVVLPIEKSAGTYSGREKAYQSYELKQYGLAVQRFEALEILETEDKVYLAISYLETGDLSKAEGLLQEVVAVDSVRWVEAAEWYQMWLLFKQERKDLATELAGIISNSEGHRYQQRAKVLLEQE